MWTVCIKCPKAKGNILKISGRKNVGPCFARNSCGTFCTLNVSSGFGPWDIYFYVSSAAISKWSEHYWWKLSGLLWHSRTVHPNPHETGGTYWDMIYHWQGELSSQVPGCSQPVCLHWFIKVLGSLIGWYSIVELWHIKFCGKHGKDKVLYPRSCLGGTSRALESRDCTEICLGGCSRLQTVQLSVFMCENHRKSLVLPHIAPAVGAFCDWFLWDHELGFARLCVVRVKVSGMQEAHLPCRASYRELPLLHLLCYLCK